MSGTNHAKDQGWGGPQPVFILVEPQMGENIGAAARGMWNFGLEHMRIVNPRDGWPNPKAEAMASGAARVLDKVLLTETTKQALGDMNFTFATTARTRDLTKPVYTPEAAMALAKSMTTEGQKIAVLFGPERAGLSNEDVVQANALISVPVNPAFASLNLAQCVLLTAYEWRRQTSDVQAFQMDLAGTDFAQQIEIQKLLERLEVALDQAGFFWPEDKAESMVLNLRNMFSRMPLTQADVRIFHGMIKTLVKDQGKPR